MVDFDEMGRPIVKENIPAEEIATDEPTKKQSTIAQNDITEEILATPEKVVSKDVTEETLEVETKPSAATQSKDKVEPLAEEAKQEQGLNVGKVAAKVIETSFGRGPVQRGLVRGVEDVYNFASWMGDTLERATGIEALLTNVGVEDGLFSNDPNFGRGAVSDYMYESQSSMGKLVEGVFSFVPGFVASGPVTAGIRQTVAMGATKLPAPKWVGMARENKTLMSVIDRAKALISNPAVQKFNEGGAKGALADFALTHEEDELISDLIGLTKPSIQETFFESLNADDPPSLMERKLRGVMEGYFMGGVANHVIDDTLAFFSRARQNGIFSNFVNTPEQQAIKKSLEVAKSEVDPVVGKTYQGEKIVKAYNIEGKQFYAKESQVANIDGTLTLKDDLVFVTPSDIGPKLGVDEFTPDITEVMDTWVKKYNEAGNLQRQFDSLDTEGNRLFKNISSVLDDLDNNRLSRIGEGGQAEVVDAGDFVLKVNKNNNPDVFKERFSIESELADNDLAPNTYLVERSDGSSVIVQEKTPLLSDYLREMEDIQSDQEGLDFLNSLKNNPLKQLSEDLDKLGFSDDDVVTSLDNLGVYVGAKEQFKLLVLDAGLIRRKGASKALSSETLNSKIFNESIIREQRSGIFPGLFTDKSIDVIEKMRAIMTGTDTDIMDAVKRGDTYGVFRGFRKKNVSLDDLSEVASSWGYDVKELGEAFPNTNAEKIAAYFYKLENSTHIYDQFLIENSSKIMNLDTDTLFKARQISDMIEEHMANFDNLGTISGQSLSVYGHYKKAISANMNASIHKFKLKGIDMDELLKKVDAMQGLTENQVSSLSKKSSSIINDILYTNYVTNLLFGATTHAYNNLSGALMLAHKNLARGITAIASTDQASRLGAQAFTSALFKKSTWADTFSEAAKALYTGKIPSHLSSAKEVAKAEEAYRVYKELSQKYSHQPILYALFKGADMVTRIPTHGLTAGDVLWKQLMYAQTTADNVAQAMSTGKYTAEQIRDNINKIGRKEFDDTIPELSFQSTIDALQREVSEVTLTMKPNQAMTMINKGLEIEFGGYKPLKFLVPFARIDMNSVRYTAQVTPGLGSFSKTNQNIFRDGTVSQQERRVAEMMATSTMLMGFGSLYSAGVVTGSGPSDQRELAALRRAGWKPYAFKVPGYGYMELKRIGPVGNFLAMGAWSMQMMESIPESDSAYKEAVTGVLHLFSETFSPTFVTDTIPKALSILANPDDARKFEGLQQLVVDKIPNSALPGTGIYSRNSALFGEGTIMEYDFEESKLATAVSRAFPFIDSSHRPQVDFLGNDRGRSPIESTKDIDLLEEYARLADTLRFNDNTFEASLVFTTPRRNLEATLYEERGRTYKLSNDEYYRYQKYAAGIYDDSEAGGSYEPFKDVWRREMKEGYPEAQAIYGSRSDEAVTTWLRNLKKDYNEEAKRLITQEYDVMEGMMKGEEREGERRRNMLERGPIRVR